MFWLWSFVENKVFEHAFPYRFWVWALWVLDLYHGHRNIHGLDFHDHGLTDVVARKTIDGKIHVIDCREF